MKKNPEEKRRRPERESANQNKTKIAAFRLLLILLLPCSRFCHLHLTRMNQCSKLKMWRLSFLLQHLKNNLMWSIFSWVRLMKEMLRLSSKHQLMMLMRKLRLRRQIHRLRENCKPSPPNQRRRPTRGAKCFPRQIHPDLIIWCPYPDGG